MKFLSRIFYRFGFITITNKKKKTGFLFISSNRTFYMTFVISLVVHAGLICAIPAVDLFSEGPGVAPFEPLVVDFYEEELPESMSEEVPQVNDNQFTAPNPAVSETEEPPVESSAEDIVTKPIIEPGEVEMLSLPAIKKSDELTESPTLFSQLTSREPRIKSLQKRQAKKPAPQLQKQEIPRQQPSEKLQTSPLQLQRHVEIDEQFKVQISPFRDQLDSQRDRPERSLQFPLHADQAERQRRENRDVPKIQFGSSGKRQTTEMKNMLSSHDTISDFRPSGVREQTLGLSPTDENDRNRFGIFAGRSFEDEAIKTAMQRTVTEKENKEAAVLPDKAPKAQNFPLESQIEGPVKGRKITRQPNPPTVDVKIEVELRLKFWVLPDGTIGEVIPIKRGDAHLERIAIAYLKQWRFEPLPPGVPQQKIWGTIPIRFTVR